MTTILNVLLVILVLAAIVLAVLYFLGRKLEKKYFENILRVYFKLKTKYVVFTSKVHICG